MDAGEIIAIIKRRRDDLFESTAGGGSEDPREYSAADVSNAIASEYDSLLREVQGQG
jgi:hypothetical protein